MTTKRPFNPSMLALAVTSVFMLSACEDSLDVEPVQDDHDHDHGHDDDHDHDHEHDGVAGRLVLSGAEDAMAWVFDLEEEAIIADFSLTGAAARVYPSPDNRYALAIQRDYNLVNFVDGGLWYDDHGSHGHEHQAEPTLLDFELTGERPTHYDYYAHLGAVFFDGNEGVPSAVEVLSDQTLSDGHSLAEVTLERAMHGAAEVRGDELFVSYRSDDTPNTLPDYVELYERHGDHYDWVERFSEPCPMLHGSTTTEHAVLFGCEDGVLAIVADHDDHDHDHDHGHSYTAMKLANPEGMTGRIGTLFSHDNTGVIVGRAGSELYRVHVPDGHDDHDHDHDHGHGDFSHIHWQSEEHPDAGIVSVAFNYSGNRLAVLADTGYLTIVRFRDDEYEIQSRMHLFHELHEDDLAPALATSAVSHAAFVTDPSHQELMVIDLHDGVVEHTYELDFVPGSAAWVGLHEHD